MSLIRTALLRDGTLRKGSTELIADWRGDSEDRLWVDIQDPVNEVIEPLLEQQFGFHELAAEDTLSANTLPKYDAFPTHDFFVFRAVQLVPEDHSCSITKLSAFLGRNFLFTIHNGAVRGIEEIYGRMNGDRRLLENGPDFLLYTVIDQLVDSHFPMLDDIEERVDDLQDEIFARADEHHLDQLLHLKRDINVLRRNLVPQRDLLNAISRGDARFVQKQHHIYFRDIYDHLFRISETIDIDRDQMASTMEAYLSVVANRTNDIMKVLTIFSAIMLPLTLIAGIYGMNFQYMPELHWLHGYPMALGLMIGIAIMMLGWFGARGWITLPHRKIRGKRTR